MNPYISIICPCYNGATYIECAITSVLSQPEEGIELIVIDDGSTDDTPYVCKKYAGDKFRYFRTDNLGTGHARNYGLDKARGTWIMYLDADDLYLNNSINEVFINRLHEYEKQRVDIIYTPCFYVDYYLKQWIKKDPAEEKISVIPKYTFWNGIYNRVFLAKNGICFYEYREQDIESAFRYLTYNSAKKTISDNDMKFYLQRENYLSNTHTWDMRKVGEIKTFVYYDLLKHHSNSDESTTRLLGELLNIIRMYFIEVKKNGYNNSRFFEVCKIAKECLSAPKASSILGGKQYIKEILRLLWCKYFAREDKTKTQKEKKDVDNAISLETVVDRLKIVSLFLLSE